MYVPQQHGRPDHSGDDTLSGGDDSDLLIGGLGNDTIRGEGNADILIGDAAEVLYADDGTTINRLLAAANCREVAEE